MTEQRNSRALWPLTAVVVLLLVTFGLRVMRLEVQSIWVDEGFSIDFASRTASDMTSMWKARGGFGAIDDPNARRLASDPLAIAVDIHPPLYYLSLHEWLPLAGKSEYAVRFPSVIAGVLLVLALFKLGQSFGSPALGLAAAGAGAVAPYYVAYSQEARMYGPVALFSAFSLYFAWLILRFHLRGRGARPWPWLWVGLVLAGGLALYTHYSAVLVIVAENLMAAGLAVWLWRRRGWTPFRRLAGPWLASQAIEGLSFAPWLRTTIGQVAQYNQNLWTPNWRVELNDTFRAFDAGLWIPPDAAERLLYGLTALLGIGLLAAAVTFRRKRKATAEHLRGPLAFGVAALALETLAALAVFQVRPEFHPRYLMVLATPFYFLWGVALLALWRRFRAAGVAVSCAFLAVSLYGLAGYQFDPNFAKDDTRTLAQYIAGRTQPGDVIFLDAPEPLDYYYHGPATMDYIPGDDPRLAQTMTALAAGKKKIVYVQWFLSTSDPQQLVPFLLQKYGHFLNEHTFRGYREWEYQIAPGTVFDLGAQQPIPPVNYAGILQLQAASLSPSLDARPDAAANLGRAEAFSGQKLMIGLTWKLLADTPRDYKVSAYLTDKYGHFAGQTDLLLYRGQATTRRWQAGDEATDYYPLQTVGGLMPGAYDLTVAVYPDGGSERLSVLDAAGAPKGGSAVVAQVQVLPPAGPVDLAQLGITHQMSAALGTGLQLDGFDLPKSTLLQGDDLPLTLFWGVTGAQSADLTTAIALRPQAGGGAAWTWTGRPSFPSSQWKPGWALRDWYEPRLPADLPPGTYTLQAGLPGHLVDLAEIHVQPRQRSFAAPNPQHSVTAQIGPGIELLGYDTDKSAYEPGETVHLTLYWRATAAMPDSYTAFAHILDAGRHVASQRDTIPVNGTLPTTTWAPGQVITDPYALPLDRGLARGTYQLETGFYRADTGLRLKASSTQLKVIDDGILLGPLEVR